MRKEELLGEAVFVVHSFLTPDECAAFIAASEQAGYADAPITMGEGTIILKDYRDNMRVMTDDATLAADLFLRVRPFLPFPLDGRLVTGLNERLRYYRYDVGQTFAAHYDGSFRRNDREESLLTFMIYLNQDYTGGTTDFYQEDGTLRFRSTPASAARARNNRLLSGRRNASIERAAGGGYGPDLSA